MDVLEIFESGALAWLSQSLFPEFISFLVAGRVQCFGFRMENLVNFEAYSSVNTKKGQD